MSIREPDKKKTAELETYWEKMAAGKVKTHDIGPAKEPTDGLVHQAGKQVINEMRQSEIDKAVAKLDGATKIYLDVFRFMGGKGPKSGILEDFKVSKLDPETNTLLIDTGPTKMAKGTLQRELSNAIKDAAVQRVLDVVTFKNHKPTVMHVQRSDANSKLNHTL